MKWILKTSSVRVATGKKDQIFRSVEDAPPEVREAMRRALEGPHAETILIANQEVYERLLKESPNLPRDLRPLERKRHRVTLLNSRTAGRQWAIALALILVAVCLLTMLGLWFTPRGTP
jgi:hypothetical protein